MSSRKNYANAHAKNAATLFVACKQNTRVLLKFKEKCRASDGFDTSGVWVVHAGPTRESEILLAHLHEGIYGALSHLMGGLTDCGVFLFNCELVFLLIAEHCNRGIILKTDWHKFGGHAAPSLGGGFGMGGMGEDMTIAQALIQARNQIISNLSQL